MKLTEILTQLSYGEFHLTNIGNSGEGTITDANYDRLVSTVNLGLASLYTRFPIKMDSLVLQLVAGKELYPIERKFAVTALTSLEPVKYIVDTVDHQYTNNWMKLLRVTTDLDEVLNLNDITDEYSITTPGISVVRVPLSIVNQGNDLPDWLHTSTLKLDYRASHPVLPKGAGGYRPETVEVDLPYEYLEALLYFIAGRLMTPTGLVDNFSAGNNYTAKYEKACAVLERDNIRVDQGSMPDRIRNKGWV